MKSRIQFFLLILILLLTATYSFSIPLNGTYTVGGGGIYPTTVSAVNAVVSQGVSGPVIFDILPGNYNDIISINSIPGTSSINTVTFQSQTGNASDVIINGAILNSRFLIFKKLTLALGSLGIYVGKNDIIITDNIFNSSIIRNSGQNARSNIIINGNTGIGTIQFHTDFFFPGNIKIIDNIVATISIINCTSLLIEKNTINELFVIGDSINIFKNKIETLGPGGIDGKTGINIQARNSSVNNNFISGFSGASALYVAGNNLKVTYNTFTGGCNNCDFANPAYSATIFLNSQTVSFYNNIIINPMHGITFYSSYSNMNSDYNNFYNGGNPDLILNGSLSFDNVYDFHTATGLDGHSNSQPVTFVSTTDLHLTGLSVGDEELLGIPVSYCYEDIDGETRDQDYPYKGADEAINAPLPVELVSFSSAVTGNNVKLNWSTSSENNNSGFEIQRSIVNGQWSIVSFLKSTGNSNTLQYYSYEDRNLSTGKYNFRLKQTDLNGNFRYYDLQNEVVISNPEKFSLGQNYPNPFNPSTVISYKLAASSYVSLKVYDISGKEIMNLINESKEAGRYEVTFDGSNFASGQYFYKIEAGNYSEVKKMLLIK